MWRPYLTVVVAAFVAIGFVAVAQEPQPAVEGLPQPAPQTWAQKLNAAVEAGEAVVFTAEEAATMLADILTLDRARVADVAVSGATVYVVSVGGEIVASTPLPSLTP